MAGYLDQRIEQERRTERARRGHWRITETVPGTWDVENCESLSRYAVWLYAESNRWACSCPDFTDGMACQSGVHCKHIEAVRLCLPQLLRNPGRSVESNVGVVLPVATPATVAMEVV